MTELRRQDLIRYSKLIGIVLCLLLAGLSVYYFVTDFFFWYIYVGFFLAGIIFLVLFKTKFKKMNREDKNFKRLLARVDKKQKNLEKKMEIKWN